MKKKAFVLLAVCYLLFAVCFAIYSYTQVDLNLTLSSNPTYQLIQQKLTYIGYFNRPFSTVLFSLFLLFSTFFYFFLFKIQKKLSLKQIWILIISSSLILTFSYPAFSHDIFNYIFNTRMLIKYQVNPWTNNALSFPADDWTRFMRWTHTGSAYPPGWLITTIPFYLMGFGKFTLTLFLYKLIAVISFLAGSWLMLKLAGKKAWILWSFNPLVIITSLISAHNDIVMVSFTLLSFWLIKNQFASYLSLVWSGLIKYISILLLPFLRHPVLAAIAAWIGSIAFFFVREINPWYILLPVSISIMSQNKYLTSLAVMSSLLILYRYYSCVAIFSC